MRKTLLLVPIVIALFACKMFEGEPAAHCNASTATDKEFCFEYSKRDYTEAKKVCSGFPGTWSETGACPRTNALGACKMSGGITKVFYSGTKFKTEDEAKGQCYDKWVGPNEK